MPFGLPSGTPIGSPAAIINFTELLTTPVTFTAASPAVLETVIKASGVVIPATGLYDIRCSIVFRHRDSAASDYEFRFQTGAPGAADSTFTHIGPHGKTSYEGAAATDDHQLDSALAAVIAAGTYDFRLAARQLTFTTTFGQALVNSLAQSTWFQIVRLS